MFILSIFAPEAGGIYGTVLALAVLAVGAAALAVLVIGKKRAT